MYPYMELADGTQIVHSHIMKEDGKQNQMTYTKMYRIKYVIIEFE